MLRFIAIMAALLLACGSALAERRAALVFANDDYRLVRPLANAVNDGRAIEEALDALGFEVTLETNRDLRRMRRALEDFREDAAGAEVALVFFSGHGVEVAGANRLLPVDADPASLEALERTTLPLEEIRETVTAVARIGLVVVDACRNDPFGQGVADGAGRGATALNPALAQTVRPGLGRMGRAENVLFSFSAAPGETASDGADGNSEFSAALAKFLPTDGLEIRSVLTLVQQEVYDRSRGRQLPYVESGLPRLFFASERGDALPERDRLLLAMAEVTPELRAEVETIAAGADMPLAPLYAALITSEGKAMAPRERQRKLEEAAASFVQVRADLRNFSASDPKVTQLRHEAEAKLALGAFEEARAKLAEAAAVDGESRESLKANFIDRTLSEATTHYLSGSAARAELRYDLALADYGKAVALYEEVDGFALPDAARYQQALSLELIGAMQTTVGNLPAAAKAYDAMAKAIEKRIAAEPDKLEHQRDLVVARNHMAEAQMAMGELEAAIAVFEQSQAAIFALFEKDPGLTYLRDLAVSFNRSGDARRLRGDGNGALADYGKGLQVSELLVAESPENLGFRRDLGVSHSKVGLALRLNNDLAGALAAYEAALDVSEFLAVKTPDDLEIRRDLTVGLNAIGDVRRLTGDNAGAFAPYERSVGISRELVALDPANTQWRRDLSVGLAKLGDAKAQAGNAGGALAEYRSALALSQHLAELDPSNVEWQRDLAVAQNKVGDMLLAQGDRPGAADAYGAGSTIAQTQLAADPDNVQRIVDAAYSRYKLGVAGVDPQTNLKSAHAMLSALQAEGRLPGAHATWIAMVETALKAAGAE
jgi:uncharacterized caspase-like protein